MANEITVSASIRAAKGGMKIGPVLEQLTLDMAGSRGITNCQTVGTSEETLYVGDLASAGYLLIKNNDSTNYLQVYGTTADAAPPIKLLAGQFALYPANSTTVYAKANTAACEVQYTFLEA